jgi:hypothetical protein
MKKEKIIIIVLTAIIIILTGICISLGIKNNRYLRMLNGEDAIPFDGDYSGIYQTQYYNEFGKSMTLTIRLDKDNYCSIQNIVTGRTTSTETTKDCTYVINDKKLIMTYNVYNLEGVFTNTKTYEGEFIDNYTIFYGNKRVYKIA